MLKVAFVAAAMAAASMAQGGEADVVASMPDAPPAGCHPGTWPELDCAWRSLDANGDGTVSMAELADFASPAPSPGTDWAALPPARAGLDFKDAAANPQPAMPAALDPPGPPTILSALLALGALVVLLRKRPR